jgi:SWI/SNF-related matrix-associated actin-dependent regulator of chromatin subfamily A-like protein 1
MNAITIVKRGEKWLAMFPWSIETKDRVKAAGFRFDPARKEWWTSEARIAATFEPKYIIGGPPLRHHNVQSDPPAAEPDIPAPPGLDYLPFQRDGILALAFRKHTLLADQMGLGKTIQAIGLINMVPNIERVLIVCPASLKATWKNELMKWCHRPMSVDVISPGSAWIPCDIVILNYEQVSKYRSEIDKVLWDLLICDESHYLKNNKAQRTQFVVGRWDNNPANRIYPIKAVRKLFMTGTPVLSRPKELWTTVRALDRDGLGADWIKFHTRYCDGYQNQNGWQVDGASNLDELQTRLRASIMVRRLKADVLKDLPPKRRQVVLLPANTPAMQRLLADERAATLKAENDLSALRARVEALSVNQADAAYKAAVQKLDTATAVAFGDTAAVRHRTALAKLISAMDYLCNVLESEDKIVVFAHHHDVIDGLVEGLAEYGVVHIDGRVSLPDRQKAVEAFQKDPKVRVIVGSIGAMGTGFTLTAASYVAFVELDWVPGNLAQAEDRLHRIGQAESVLVQHLMLEGSFDGRMAATVVHKMGVIEKAVG